jgi:hypothetical protein
MAHDQGTDASRPRDQGERQRDPDLRARVSANEARARAAIADSIALHGIAVEALLEAAALREEFRDLAAESRPD